MHSRKFADVVLDDFDLTHAPRLIKSNPQESTFYDNNSDESFAPVGNRKRSALVRGDSEIQSNQSIDSLDVYEFNELDAEPMIKKGRQTKQPKKRNKPASFPRIKMTETPRRQKSYTVGRSESITPPEKVKKTEPQSHAKALENLAKINANSPKATSNITKVSDAIKPPVIPKKKNNGVKKPQKLYTRIFTDDMDDEDQDGNVEIVDLNGNITVMLCPCISVHEKEPLIRQKLKTIFESTNHALDLCK